MKKFMKFLFAFFYQQFIQKVPCYYVYKYRQINYNPLSSKKKKAKRKNEINKNRLLI